MRATNASKASVPRRRVREDLVRKFMRRYQSRASGVRPVPAPARATASR